MKVTKVTGKEEGEKLLADIIKEGGQTDQFAHASSIPQVMARLEAIAIEKPWLKEEIELYIRNAQEAQVSLAGWQAFVEKMESTQLVEVETEVPEGPSEEEIIPQLVQPPPPPPQSVKLEEEPEPEEVKATRQMAELVLSQPVYAKTSPYIGVPNGPQWEMIDLPSGYIFYDFKEMFARPFVVRELRKLSPVQRSNSISTMLDVIASVVSVDPRVLTQEDFYYVLYWLRAKSFVKSPMVVKWTSRYGINDVTTITQTMLEETKLNRDEHEKIFLEASKQGFDWPRMYDLDSSGNVDFDVVDDGMTWLYQHSRYFKPLPGETIRQRMERVDVMGNEMLETARDVKMKLYHGVTEFVPVTLDKKKFDVEKVLATLEERAAQLIKLNEELEDEALTKTIEELVEEINDIKEKTAQGVDVLPRPERTRAVVNISAFFPGV